MPNDDLLTNGQKEDYMRRYDLVLKVQALIIYSCGLKIYNSTERSLMSKDAAILFKRGFLKEYQLFSRDPVIGYFIQQVPYRYLNIAEPKATNILSGDDFLMMFMKIESTVLHCLGRIYKR